MKVIEVTGSRYPTAVELPNKNRRWVNGTNKSAGGNSAPKKRNKIFIPTKMAAELQTEAQARTKAGARMLVIDRGKKRWVRLSDWKG